MNIAREHVYPAALAALRNGSIVMLIPGHHDGEPCIYTRRWKEPRAARRVTRSADADVRAMFHIQLACAVRRLAEQRGVQT